MPRRRLQCRRPDSKCKSLLLHDVPETARCRRRHLRQHWTCRVDHREWSSLHHRVRIVRTWPPRILPIVRLNAILAQRANARPHRGDAWHAGLTFHGIRRHRAPHRHQTVLATDAKPGLTSRTGRISRLYGNRHNRRSSWVPPSGIIEPGSRRPERSSMAGMHQRK